MFSLRAVSLLFSITIIAVPIKADTMVVQDFNGTLVLSTASTRVFQSGNEFYIGAPSGMSFLGSNVVDGQPGTLISQPGSFFASDEVYTNYSFPHDSLEITFASLVGPWQQNVPCGVGYYPPCVEHAFNGWVTWTDGISSVTDNFEFENEDSTPPSTISGRVFNDLTGHGIDDPELPGLAHQQVDVFLANPGSLLYGEGIASTFTDSSGDYTISGLVAGDYIIKAPVPDGVTQTFYPANPINLSTGQALLSVDFGDDYIPEPSSIWLLTTLVCGILARRLHAARRERKANN